MIKVRDSDDYTDLTQGQGRVSPSARTLTVGRPVCRPADMLDGESEIEGPSPSDSWRGVRSGDRERRTKDGGKAGRCSVSEWLLVRMYDLL